MGRFERDDITAQGLPDTVDNATADLRSAIERQVHEIVDAARATAAEIEDQALQTASAIELESRRRADEILNDALDQAAQMLATIDSLQGAISGNVASLRAEAVGLFQALESARPGDVQVNDIAPEEEPAEMAADETPQPAPEDEPDDPPDPEPNNEIRVLLAAQLRDMRQAGQDRADAERYLMRFKQGESNIDLLDEIYERDDQQSSGAPRSGRKGLRRRRKS